MVPLLTSDLNEHSHTDLFDQKLLIELLNEIDLLGAMQLVLERLQYTTGLDVEHLEGHMTAIWRFLIDEQHDAWADLDLVDIVVVNRVQVIVVL